MSAPIILISNKSNHQITPAPNLFVPVKEKLRNIVDILDIIE